MRDAWRSVALVCTAQNGWYTLIWSSTTTAVPSGPLTYQSSGALTAPVALVSGRFYVIGVGSASTATIDWYHVPATAPVPTSFGDWVAGYIGGAFTGTPPTSPNISTYTGLMYSQRITTGPS